MFQEILTHLSQNKLRTALTGLSVSMGIFLLIFLLGAGNGLIHAFQQNSSGFANDIVQLWPGYTSKAYDGLPEGRSVRFNKRDITQTAIAFPHNITAGAATFYGKESTFRYAGQRTRSDLLGVYPVAQDMEKINIIAGRFINDIDMKEQRKSIVIADKTALELFPSVHAAIGKDISVDALNFRVVGVRSNRASFGNTPQSYIPFTTMSTTYAMSTENLGKISFRVKNIATDSLSQKFERDVRRSIARRHRFDPTDENAIWLNNAAQGAKESNTTMIILNRALWVIGLLTLLSGVVSISNIMLITVKERTHEFGIRKALGARPWSILRSVLLESIIVTLLSGYFGLVVGIAATEWMGYVSGKQIVDLGDMKFYTFLDPTVDLGTAIAALVVLIIAGLIAGFFPARKAVKVKPIEALNAK